MNGRTRIEQSLPFGVCVLLANQLDYHPRCLVVFTVALTTTVVQPLSHTNCMPSTPTAFFIFVPHSGHLGVSVSRCPKMKGNRGSFEFFMVVRRKAQAVKMVSSRPGLGVSRSGHSVSVKNEPGGKGVLNRNPPGPPDLWANEHTHEFECGLSFRDFQLWLPEPVLFEQFRTNARVLFLDLGVCLCRVVQHHSVSSHNGFCLGRWIASSCLTLIFGLGRWLIVLFSRCEKLVSR